MKLVVQRVQKAEVKVDDEIISEIGKGLLVFLGIGEHDEENFLPYFQKKLLHLRIFEDEQGKMNFSVLDIGGEILLVSQFTLYANCARGNKPDFISAAKREKAIIFYNKFAEGLQTYLPVKQGIFGADMKICSINDGPVTIILEK